MGREDFKLFMDNVMNYVGGKTFEFPGSTDLLSKIITKEVNFLLFLTIVYIITLAVKQRSRSMYKYLVALTVATIAIYTFYVSTMFDESVKNGTASEEVLKGLPPVSVFLIIRMFNIVPPLKLFYYTLPFFMIAYSIYYHRLSMTQKTKSRSKSISKSSSKLSSSKPSSSKSPSQSPTKSSSSSKSRGRTHSHSHHSRPKSLKGFIRVSLSMFTDFVHSFILFYAYAVLVFLIFINNNYDFTINSINTGSNAYGKVLKYIDFPFLNKA